MKILKTLLRKWHGLNMHASVKQAIIGAIALLLAALVSGLFMLVNTYFQHRLEKRPIEKTSDFLLNNNGSIKNLQQQNVNTINNYVFSGSGLSKSTLDNSEKIKGLKNGDFEQGLNDWGPNEIQVATPDVGVTSAHREVFSIDPYGRTGQCLLITNEQPTTPNKPFWRRQRIYSLKPKSNYELSFYVKGFANSPRSLWFAIGDNWFLEGKRYMISAQKPDIADWQKQSAIFTTGDWQEAYLWLISDDIARLRVDDIQLTEIK